MERCSNCTEMAAELWHEVLCFLCDVLTPLRIFYFLFNAVTILFTHLMIYLTGFILFNPSGGVVGFIFHLLSFVSIFPYGLIPNKTDHGVPVMFLRVYGIPIVALYFFVNCIVFVVTLFPSNLRAPTLYLVAETISLVAVFGYVFVLCILLLLLQYKNSRGLPEQPEL
jgi:hypothetical protein